MFKILLDIPAGFFMYQKQDTTFFKIETDTREISGIIKTQKGKNMQKDMRNKELEERVLQSLPEEYDRTYVVDADTIQSAILNRSGYRISHRPFFSMRYATRSKWELNPHAKTGVDAAPNAAETISFQEYLKLFEDDHESRKENTENERK